MIEGVSGVWGALGVVFLGIVALTMFAMTPLSNVLNVVTIPLGYEWQSCPYCPAFGVEKITHAECVTCGARHAENFGSAVHRDGDEFRFCSLGCSQQWRDDS